MFTIEQLEEIVQLQRDLISHPSDIEANNPLAQRLLSMMQEVIGNSELFPHDNPEVCREIAPVYQHDLMTWPLGDMLDIQTLGAFHYKAMPHLVVRFVLAYNGVLFNPVFVPAWDEHGRIYREMILKAPFD